MRELELFAGGDGEFVGVCEVSAPRRPIVRYHGGKWKLADWIIGHFPKHKVYVEPFGGGASVLLKKPRSYAEIYNDLDGEISNVFQMMRDRGEELKRAIELTPFSRMEFMKSYEPTDDPLEWARRTIARSFMGFGSAAVCGESTGFRSNSNRLGTTPAQDWRNYPMHIPSFIERLMGVVIETKDAVGVMLKHDGEETLHYVDPPYVHSTRHKRISSRRGGVYKYEMDDSEHRRLAEVLNSLRGTVILSGYRCDLYDEIYGDWERVDKNTHADGARDRVESLYLSKNHSALQLFSGAK